MFTMNDEETTYKRICNLKQHDALYNYKSLFGRVFEVPSHNLSAFG